MAGLGIEPGSSEPQSEILPLNYPTLAAHKINTLQIIPVQLLSCTNMDERERMQNITSSESWKIGA